MKIVGFVGAFDKIDMMLYVGKLLTLIGKKVIIVDTSVMQKARYIVPAINPTISYITEFEKIDISVGMYTFSEIYQYLGKSELEYDYALVNIDESEKFDDLGMNRAIKNYFITSFDTYSIKKGLEILSNIEQPLIMEKVLFTNEIYKEDDNYLNYLSSGYKIKWSDSKVYFPLEKGDQTAIIENQKLERIKYKNLTGQYKDSLAYITEELIDYSEISKLTKILKNIDKGE